MSGTIIFKIEIKRAQGGFAQASNFISKMSVDSPLNGREVIGIQSVLYGGTGCQPIDIAKFVLEQEQKFESIGKPEFLGASKAYEVWYCLWIEEEALKDIIDLQYDFLIKKFFKQCNIITILAGSNDIYFKASHYLYNISCTCEELYNRFFYKQIEKNTLIRLQKRNVGGLSGFMPLYYFSEEEKDFLKAISVFFPIDIIQGALLGKKNADSSISPILRGGLKALNCAAGCMTAEESLQVSVMLYKGNVLEFLLFAYIFSEKEFWEESTWEDIQQYYFRVKECASGCEQLTDNIIGHSTAGFGGISIRVHKTDSDYVQARYPIQERARRYVEILITDYAGINTYGNIADNFCMSFDDDEKELFVRLQPIDFLTEALEDDKRGQKIKAAFRKYNQKAENIGRHIGLKIFRKIVAENNGMFGFYSHKSHIIGEGENYQFNEYCEDYCLPGTGYAVLFPIINRERIVHRSEIGIDYNINFDEHINEYVDGYECFDLIVKKENFEYDSQEKKESAIANVAQILSEERYSDTGKRKIIYISAEEMEAKIAEYFAKALMIASYEKRIPDYVFYDCTGDFVSVFQQTMAVYFGMRDLAHIYKGREFVIALYTRIPVEGCFIIPGHYNMTIWANRTNCYLGTEYMGTGWLMPYHELYKAENEVKGNVPPYDILHKVKSGAADQTIFEKYTLQVLETDIQEAAFGCKVKNTHMRLGSTIHIDSFYEAELLFSNRLFASRFAYLLANGIRQSEQFQKAQKVTLYSYALYSEMMIVETIHILGELCRDKEIDYAILERESDHRDFSHVDRIRYGRDFESEQKRREYFKDRKIICIVPINSTLKTHEKLLSLFSENNGENCAENIIMNYALILVGSKGGNKYWEINETEKTFNKIALNIKPLPRYFISVKVDYYEAIDCKLCFPGNPMDEVPLVEVNAASTIPNQSFGLYGHGKADKISYEKIQKEEQELLALKDVLVYSHTQRGENHFLYYFKTDELFLRQKHNIADWLRSISEKIEIRTDEYHVLFCPSHYSNAGFLECVNRIVFREAALTIRVDVDKEYRSNICAKYSNLAALINLLNMEDDERHTVKIYYVDDSIITGRTFFRAKSLISSVVKRYQKEYSKVDVHIFEKIFVLLDRNSLQSRLQYIGCWDSRNKKEEQVAENYLAYRTLRISSMRSHGDSCILCQLEREAKILQDSSATNQMQVYWKKQNDKFQVKHLRDKKEEEQIVPTPEKSFRRMFCCHMATIALSEEIHGNKKEKVAACLIDLLIADYIGRKADQGQERAFEYFLSYLKIVSRPFLLFDKAIKEAVFDIQLILAEGLLEKRPISNILEGTSKEYLLQYQGEFNVILDGIITQDFSDSQRLDLMKLLLKQLTEMKSNYFIRVNNILRLSRFAAQCSKNETEILYERFLQQIKKLLGVSSDTSKSAWFSHEIYGRENILGLPEHILGRLLLENTRAYYDGLEKLCKCGEGVFVNEDALGEELSKPLYRDFVSVLVDMGLAKTIGETLHLENEDQIIAAVKLLNLCKSNILKKPQQSDKKIESICREIIGLMKKIICARDIKLLLECPLECDTWGDNLRQEYNKLVEQYRDIWGLQPIRLQNRKEYLVIADSEREINLIEGVEIRIAERLRDYHELGEEEKIKGIYINGEKQYMVWEIGNADAHWEDQRRLLVYAEYDDMILPNIWHKVRNLMCMNHSLNNAVFNEDVIDYLFELILADKKNMLYNLDKSHSHTANNIRAVQYDRACWNASGEDGEHRSFVLTLLSDLQVSQVYRNSLKEDYYCKHVSLYLRRSEDIFAVFQNGEPLAVVDQQEISKCNKIYVEFPEGERLNEGEQKLESDERIISYSEANGANEVSLLLLALIMNAAGTNRGLREKEGGTDDKSKIIVYLTKTDAGDLRISNKCVGMDKTPEEINAELLYPPQQNAGISLWSVSRYVQGIISVLLSKKLARIKAELTTEDEACSDQKVKKMLTELRESIEKMLGKEYYITVGNRQGEKGMWYFYIDVPILADKYSDFDQYFGGRN